MKLHSPHGKIKGLTYCWPCPELPTGN